MPDSPAQRIVVRARGPLEGSVAVSGAKNSVLKLMAATLLAPGTSHIANVPAIADVGTMGELLGAMGVQVSHDPASASLTLTAPACPEPRAPYELVERIRASIVVLGPLLARCGTATVSLPGGDDFGPRPIDMHLRGLEALGARFELDHGDVIGHAPDGLRGADVTLEFPSVGATENLVMASVLAKGTTVIDNAAREPEIADLCTFLVAMGADIDGIGSSTIVVRGVERLRPAEHVAVPDRIEAATYLAAVGVAGGDVVIRGARADHMEMLLVKLRDMGMVITSRLDGIGVVAHRRLASVDVATLPYPGVATDYKPLVTAMLCVADGTAIVSENLFPGRFKYVDELVRMGAQIRTDAHHAVVRGVERLSGCPVRAHDIRAGAAVMVAALGATGETTVSGVEHLARGYADLPGALARLGAEIEVS